MVSSLKSSIAELEEHRHRPGSVSFTLIVKPVTDNVIASYCWVKTILNPENLHWL